jgi:DNA-3-methyladenine glycosylase II
VAAGGQCYVGFPSPETLRRITVEKLRAIQFSRRKAEYLIGFARAIDNGEVDELALRRASDEEIRDQLVQYRGIGRWTADMILMRALGRLDILPSFDTGLQTAYGLAFKRPRPTSDELLELTAGWTGFRTYATFYLWAYLGSTSSILSRVSDEPLYS